MGKRGPKTRWRDAYSRADNEGTSPLTGVRRKLADEALQMLGGRDEFGWLEDRGRRGILTGLGRILHEARIPAEERRQRFFQAARWACRVNPSTADADKALRAFRGVRKTKQRYRAATRLARDIVRLIARRCHDWEDLDDEAIEKGLKLVPMIATEMAQEKGSAE